MVRCALAAALLLATAAVQAEVPIEAAQMSGEASTTPAIDPAALALADTPLAKSNAPLLRWPTVEEDSLAALRERNRQASTKVLQIGVHRDAPQGAFAELATELDWQPLADGSAVALLRVQSPGAVALRVALDLRGLPDGAELRFAGDGEALSVVEPVTAAAIAAARAMHPHYWSPVTEGDTQVIELRLPAGSDHQWLRLGVPALSHLVASPFGALDGAKIGESGACNFDVSCVSNPSQAYTNAKDAVARMTFQTPQGTGLCTGTLLNDDNPSNQVPYFFTAAHCFTSQAIASTLTTFWFFESTGCRSNVLNSAGVRQVAGGATVLFANEGSDVLFLRLNNPPPSNAFFLGWNASAVAANSDILTLHHPSGDVKKVSLGSTTGTGSSGLASGSFIKAGYTDGTTEGGSSGCGLLTFSGSEYQLRGGLLGGTASCANTGSLTNAGNSDDFSRFDLAFPNLRSFLQTGGTTPPPGTDYTGAWSNAAQDGWGLVVIRGASGAYAMYIYHYDQDGSPGWYLSADNLNGANFSTDLLAFRGPWFGTTPFNPAQVTLRDAGEINVTFSSATAASISFTIDGRTVSTTLSKLAF